MSMKIRFVGKLIHYLCVFHYFNVDFTLTDYDLIDMNESLIEKYLLMLQAITIKNAMIETSIITYYCIDSNWEEVDENIELINPRSPFCSY